MSEKPQKVKIMKMTYDKEDHLFIMKVKNMVKEEEVDFAIRAEDFGINKDIPIEIINNFCVDMEGKEKNLIINRERSKMVEIYKRNKGELSEREVEKLHSDLDKYPYKELVKKRIMEMENNENENLRGRSV